jgi:acyl transferase domain-containing protein
MGNSKRYLYQKGGVFSPDGHVRAFSADAAGTVSSDGVGVVALKRLEDAVRDGDHIYAVILGSAVNNDGSQKASYAAPSAEGQMKVIQEALSVADVDPHTIGYIETHGTATHIGDAVEITALKRVFEPYGLRRGACLIGSVKPNIGHTDQAAGVINLIKAALIVNTGIIPQSLHCDDVNPLLELQKSPFAVNQAPQPWPTSVRPRRAGVSSFGFGGTNAHVVLEEPPPRQGSPSTRSFQLLTLSARSQAALERSTEALADHLEQNTDLSLADTAFVLQQGRRRLSHRRFVVASSIAEAQRLLRSRDRKAVVDRVAAGSAPPVYFLFPGQGAQFVDMGRELYASEPIFRDEVNRAADAFLMHGIDLLSVLFPADGNREASVAAINQTRNTQPALFAVEVALARLLMAYGVSPNGLLGHSVGELVAACLAGVFVFEDAVALVALRGRLMQELPAGTMLSVQSSPPQLSDLLPAHVAIAAVNAEHMCVLSGETPALAPVEAALAQRGIACQRLHTSHAFHSAMMDPIVETFARAVSQVERSAALTIPFISNVTGTWITPEQPTSPNYWGHHLRDCVLFADGATTLLASEDAIFIEVGPGRSLSSLLRQQKQLTATHTVLRAMRHPRESGAELDLMLTTLGTLWLNQVSIDWRMFHAHEPRRRVPLPTYPFERTRYFASPRVLGGSVAVAGTLGAASTPGEESSDASAARYDRPSLGSSFRAPETRFEMILAEVWQRVLGFKQVGADDNFFELGGHSLSAIHVVSSVKERFLIAFDISDLLDHPRLADVAALIEERLLEKLESMSEEEVARLLAD